MGLNQELDVDATFQRGLHLHKQGLYQQAKAIYEQVLVYRPEHFDSLHLLGVIANQTKNPNVAIEFIGRALTIASNNAAAYSNIGLAFQELNRFDEALNSYNNAIQIDPNFCLAYYNRGNTLQKLKRFEEAIDSYTRAIDISPDYPEAFCNRAIAYQELKKFKESINSFGRTIPTTETYAEAFNICGVSLKELGRLEEAVASYQVAIELKKNYADAHSNLGVVLHKLKRFHEALESCDRAIAINPSLPGAHYNRGVALQGLSLLDQALESYNKAIEMNAEYAEAYCNRGVVLQELAALDEAIDSYSRASALNNNYPSAYWNKSVALLLKGDLKNGWPLYEWRWTPELTTSTIRNFKQPLWLGKEDLSGKTILLHCEQGVGDSIQFCRYAKLVDELGARVILEAPKSLVGLFSNLEGVVELIEAGQALPAFDYHCPLMSLPLAFDTEIASIPLAKAYLSSAVDLRKIWSDRLGAKTKPRIGIVWSGSTTHKNDRNRSLKFEEFIKYLPRTLEYVCLQNEVREVDIDALEQSQIKYYGGEIKDFTDTAALCDLMDLVISVDTSVAHLSAAIGKETWVLLPYVPDWRWLLNRNDTPWYECVELFRQDHKRDWSSVLNRISKKLVDYDSMAQTSQEDKSIMKCFYINLDNQERRRLLIEDNFKLNGKTGWSLTRWPAHGIDYVESMKIEGKIRSAEKGCFLSHKSIIDSQIESTSPIMILEDDAIIGRQTCHVIEACLTQLSEKNDWDITFTDIAIAQPEKMLELFKLKRRLAANKQFELLSLHNYFFSGATAYILSPRGIEKLSKIMNSDKPLDLPYDLFLRNLIWDGKLNGSVIFPFVTCLSEASTDSQIQNSDSLVTDYVWNSFRRLVWNESNLEELDAAMTMIKKEVCDPEAEMLGLIMAGCVSSKFVSK